MYVDDVTMIPSIQTVVQVLVSRITFPLATTFVDGPSCYSMKSIRLILSILPLSSGFLANNKKTNISVPPVKSSSASAKEGTRLFPFEEARKIARGHGFS